MKLKHLSPFTVSQAMKYSSYWPQWFKTIGKAVKIRNVSCKIVAPLKQKFSYMHLSAYGFFVEFLLSLLSISKISYRNYKKLCPSPFLLNIRILGLFMTWVHFALCRPTGVTIGSIFLPGEDYQMWPNKCFCHLVYLPCYQFQQCLRPKGSYPHSDLGSIHLSSH